jgi:hypothetical protein
LQKWKFHALANTVPRRYIRGKTLVGRVNTSTLD